VEEAPFEYSLIRRLGFLSERSPLPASKSESDRRAHKATEIHEPLKKMHTGALELLGFLRPGEAQQSVAPRLRAAFEIFRLKLTGPEQYRRIGEHEYEEF
jgi:hypothetical protein